MAIKSDKGLRNRAYGNWQAFDNVGCTILRDDDLLISPTKYYQLLLWLGTMRKFLGILGILRNIQALMASSIPLNKINLKIFKEERKSDFTSKIFFPS